MTFEEFAAELLKLDREGANRDVDWKRDTRLWAQLEKKADRLISSIAPGAFCTAQEWDLTIDCSIKLPNGSVVTEMVGLRELTEQRLTDSAERLQRCAQGESLPHAGERRSCLMRPI